MSKFRVTNSTDFEKALQIVDNYDTLEFAPGEYFTTPKCYTIDKSLTIKGQSLNAENTKLNCGFLLGSNVTLNLENLTLNYAKNGMNTIALYDGAEMTIKNSIVDHSASDNWNTIYSQDSFISIIDSEIINNTNQNTPSICLIKGKLYAVNSKIFYLQQKNSKVFLKKSLVSYAVKLSQKSSLEFRDLTIVSLNNLKSGDFQLNQSVAKGEDLIFAKRSPIVKAIDSRFQIRKFEPAADKITWDLDDDSIVIIDGTMLDDKHDQK